MLISRAEKTTILEIGFNHKSEKLAKNFNDNLVKIVNQFYNETKTLKTSSNLKILQRQSDSVKKHTGYINNDIS